MPRAYRLTHQLVAAHSGGPVVCLDLRAVGQQFRLHARRPGPEANIRLRGEVVSADGVLDLAPADEGQPVLTRVDIMGPLEQRAGYHDICGGWSDGHDAIRERLEAAFADGDVLLVVDSPGGAAAGLDEAVRGALRAKEAFGRRVIACVNELCCSACSWWVLALADEVYLPRAAQIGHIGARGGHRSIAEQLKMEGVEVTYFTAPDPAKVAYAPELPLSELAKERGERDVWDAYLAFEEAVCAGPLGQRYGLSPERLRALKCDVLSGQAAVDAGLADGVASLDDVEEYALALASGGGEASMKLGAKGPKDPGDDDENEGGDDGEGGEEEELEEADKRECTSCGQANEEDAKFCKKCGAQMATGRPTTEEEEEPPPPASGPPASHKPPPGGPPPPKENRSASRAARRSSVTLASSLAEILGLREGASMPAAKTQALRFRAVVDRVAALTGSRSPAEMIGGLDRIEQDLGRLMKVEQDARKTARRAAAKERVDILKELVAIGGPEHERGKLLEDLLDDKGARIGVKPTELWGPGPKGRSLENLRGYLRQARAAAPPKRRTPYDPDPERAENENRDAAAGARVTERDRELGSALGLDPKALAASGAALFGPNGSAKTVLGNPRNA